MFDFPAYFRAEEVFHLFPDVLFIFGTLEKIKCHQCRLCHAISFAIFDSEEITIVTEPIRDLTIFFVPNQLVLDYFCYFYQFFNLVIHAHREESLVLLHSQWYPLISSWFTRLQFWADNNVEGCAALDWEDQSALSGHWKVFRPVRSTIVVDQVLSGIESLATFLHVKA